VGVLKYSGTFLARFLGRTPAFFFIESGGAHRISLKYKAGVGAEYFG
jgi:hypothetical protein